MTDYLTRACPECGGRLCVNSTDPDRVYCDTCEYEENAGHDLWIDFGNGKSETMIYESRGKCRFKVRYDLPDDPNMRSCRNWFDEQFSKRLEEFFAKRVKEVEVDILAWIKSSPICYVNPCEAILDGICGVITPAIYPHGNVLAERYDVAEFFLQFPRALPTELKGVAV